MSNSPKAQRYDEPQTNKKQVLMTLSISPTSLQSILRAGGQRKLSMNLWALEWNKQPLSFLSPLHVNHLLVTFPLSAVALSCSTRLSTLQLITSQELSAQSCFPASLRDDLRYFSLCSREAEGRSTWRALLSDQIPWLSRQHTSSLANTI